MSERSAKEVVAELFRRQQDGDETLDDLVAANMVNHAAGPQGRDGLRRILRTIDDDLGPITVEQHHLIGDDDLVAQHLTVHGTHRASTMPLLANTPASGRATAWTFIHIWRVEDGRIVEHWACRDDIGLLEQVRSEAISMRRYQPTGPATMGQGLQTDVKSCGSSTADSRSQADPVAAPLPAVVRSANAAQPVAHELPVTVTEAADVHPGGSEPASRWSAAMLNAARPGAPQRR